MVRTEGFVCQNYYVLAFGGGGGGHASWKPRVPCENIFRRDWVCVGLGWHMFIGSPAFDCHEKPFWPLKSAHGVSKSRFKTLRFGWNFRGLHSAHASELGPLFERRSTQPISNFVQYTASLWVSRSWYLEMGSSCRRTILPRVQWLGSSAPKVLDQFSLILRSWTGVVEFLGSLQTEFRYDFQKSPR